MSLKNIDK